MMLRVLSTDLFPGYELFSADLEEGISVMPQLRLVLGLKQMKRFTPQPALPEAAVKRSAKPGIDPWLGQPVEVVFAFESENQAAQQCRIPTARDSFRGVVTGYEHDTSGAVVVTVEPTLALFKRRVRSRTFCNKDTGDVIRTVLDECQVKYRFSDKLGTKELLTQYEESDADFVLRLIGEHRLCYAFVSGKGSEEMVILRHPRMSQGIASKPLEVKYPPTTVIDERTPQLYRWDVRREFCPGRFTARQSYAAKPGSGDTAETKSSRATPRELTVHHSQTRPTSWQKRKPQEAIPPAMMNPDWGRRYAEGGGTLFLRPADCFHEPGAETLTPDNLFVVHMVRHSIQEGIRGQQASYFNWFTARPDGLPVAQPPARPTIHGTQYATVIAKDGKLSSPGAIDLHEDRAWVQFVWDSSDQPRVPVRLAPGLARSFGPLHVGQLVRVEFENGNPDAPMIVGLAPAHEPKKQPHDVKAHPAGFTLRLPPSSPTTDKNQDVVLQAETMKDQARVVAYSPGRFFAHARKLLGLLSLGSLILRAKQWLSLHSDEHIVLKAGKTITLEVGASRIVLTEREIAIDAPDKIYIGDGGPAAQQAPDPGDDGMPK